MWLLPVALLACLPEEGPPRNCETRTAFYPDEDGDGLGEPTDVYYGCDAPAGWVTALDTAATSTADTGATSTADTGAPTTADTAAHSGAGTVP